MEKLASIIISVLALSLSAFTFYWTTLRDKKALYLVGVRQISPSMMPEFALVNGGKSDLLITHLSCEFHVEKDHSDFGPAQKIEFNESDSFLLQGGKAFHCKVKFLEPFTSQFIQSGTIERNENCAFYMFDLKVRVSWIHTNGKTYECSSEIYSYGFDETGKIRKRKPLTSKVNLYQLTS